LPRPISLGVVRAARFRCLRLSRGVLLRACRQGLHPPRRLLRLCLAGFRCRARWWTFGSRWFGQGFGPKTFSAWVPCLLGPPHLLVRRGNFSVIGFRCSSSACLEGGDDVSAGLIRS